VALGPCAQHVGCTVSTVQPIQGHSLAKPVIEIASDVPFAHALCFPVHEVRCASAYAIEALVAPESLSVVFQPIVRLATGEVFAYEALTRCQEPALSNPEFLFERARHTGCSGRLGRMARDLAVKQCGGVPLFLNVHPRELEERWIVRPDDPIFAHDRTIFLEITEAEPLAHPELCRSVLREIRKRTDVRLVIDDLGSGFSNLQLIADLEPDVVKLDRSLVTSLHKDPRRRVVVKGIVQMCAQLGARVVAEGIEVVEELKAARDCGAHFGQGFLFARPDFPLPLRNRLERADCSSM
jgi:EAL domain-containing protein (putative c-di-GMP-specific phosphodiesterase class I)